MGLRLVCVKKLVTTRPVTGRQALKATDGRGEIFKKGKVEKVFMIWAMGFLHNRCGKAHSLTV